MLSVVFVAASLALSVSAAAVPSEPSPGRIFPPGGNCEISWEADTTGTWTQTYIQLMTGANNDMRHLTTVYGPFDATNAAVTTYNYPCPDVTIHAPVLFYQFTSPASFADEKLIQWTGRFSIGLEAEIVAPPLTDAEGIGYGIAELVNPAAAVAAPPTAPGGTGVPDPNPNPGGTTPPGSASQTNSRPGPTSTSSGHAMPGPASNTTSNSPPPANTNQTAPDAAVSLRGSVAALFAAAAAVCAFL